MTFLKSFRYIINDKGPKIDPCGTPFCITSLLQSVSLCCTICSLPFKYDFNSSNAVSLIP